MWIKLNEHPRSHREVKGRRWEPTLESQADVWDLTAQRSGAPGICVAPI